MEPTLMDANKVLPSVDLETFRAIVEGRYEMKYDAPLILLPDEVKTIITEHLKRLGIGVEEITFLSDGGVSVKMRKTA